MSSLRRQGQGTSEHRLSLGAQATPGAIGSELLSNRCKELLTPPAVRLWVSRSDSVRALSSLHVICPKKRLHNLLQVSGLFQLLSQGFSG